MRIFAEDRDQRVTARLFRLLRRLLSALMTFRSSTVVVRNELVVEPAPTARVRMVPRALELPHHDVRSHRHHAGLREAVRSCSRNRSWEATNLNLKRHPLFLTRCPKFARSCVE